MIESNQLTDAEAIVNANLQANPNNPQGIWALGLIARQSGKTVQAFQLLGKAAFLMPDQCEPLLSFGDFLLECDEIDKARAVYERAIAKFANVAQVYFAYGRFLLSINDSINGKQAVEKCFALDSNHGGSLLILSELSSEEAAPQLIEKILKALSSSRTDNKFNLLPLNYAIANCYHKLKMYDLAFEYYAKANDIQFRQCEFKTSELQPFFSKVKESFTQYSQLRATVCAKLEDRPGQLSSEENNYVTPIFILGMPRSGSTLVEQMLSAYPKIETAGEVNYVAKDLVGTLIRQTEMPYPENLTKFDAKLLKLAADSYLNKLKFHAPNARWVIDKLPANFQSIGLIRLAFPDAKILHVKREPTAVALSIFKNYFQANEPYFCNLEELALYYAEYQKLVEFWQKLEIDFEQIDYESLVKEPKETLSPVLTKWGIDWDDSYLDYHQEKQAVHTLSQLQVRKPLYQSSIEQWRYYEESLQPFSDALNKHLTS